MKMKSANNFDLSYIDYDSELAEYFGTTIEEVREMKGKSKFKEEWKEKVTSVEDANRLYVETKANLLRQMRPNEKRIVLYRRILKNILKTQVNRSIWEFSGKMLSSYSKNRVLDYGCGIGDIGLILTMLGYDVDLLEIDGSELEKFIRWRFDKKYLPYNFIPYGEELKSDCYDIVVCIDVLEHHEKPRQALTDMHKSLKAGGYLFLQYGWHERKEYKELGDLRAREEFIDPFLREKFIQNDRHWFWFIKK